MLLGRPTSAVHVLQLLAFLHEYLDPAISCCKKAMLVLALFRNESQLCIMCPTWCHLSPSHRPVCCYWQGRLVWDIGQLSLALKHAGGLQDEPSFAFNRAVRPASAPETKAAPYSSLSAAPAWAAPAGSEGSAGTARSARRHPAPAGVQPDMTSASQKHDDVSPAGANRLCSRQQQHRPGHVMAGHLDSTLRDDAAMPAPVNKAAQSSVAGVNDFAAYTPQELADHLQQLKKEFREIYSSILDGDSHSLCQVAAEGVSLLALPRCQVAACTVLVFGFSGAHAVAWHGCRSCGLQQTWWLLQACWPWKLCLQAVVCSSCP